MTWKTASSVTPTMMTIDAAAFSWTLDSASNYKSKVQRNRDGERVSKMMLV
jgi:hypothetical protein